MAFRLVNRIYVSNIPWTIGKKEFREYFAQFGRIIRAEVLFDRETGLSKSYGFVHFGSEEAYSNVIKQQNHFLEGQYLEIEDQKSSDRRSSQRIRLNLNNENNNNNE